MQLTRREAFATGALALAAPLSAQDDKKVVKRGKIRQSVARWCYGKIKLPDLCKACAEMGLPAIDLLGPAEWAVARDHGLAVSTAMVGGGIDIPNGLNHKDNHDKIVKTLEANIPRVKEAGIPNIVCFFGNRRGMADQEGIDNSIECLNKVKALAEESKVTIVVENLNSKVDHKDYIGDRMGYCLAVIKGVDSPNVKVLYDIYHAQIMEGDIIRTIQQSHKWIGHYHTGGVPGRAEIDETQELHYPPIVKAILKTGFAAYMAHEFIPRKADPIQSLRDAVALCDVE